MKIPPKLRIVSSNYKVEIVNGDVEYHGQCNHDTKIIHISRKVQGDELGGTYFHEIAHAILDQFGVRLKPEMEEKVVWALEHGFKGFAKDHQKEFIEIVKLMGDK